MAKKYFEHNNTILDLTKKRMSKSGIEIKNLNNNDNDFRFILKYMTSYNGSREAKVHLDENLKKTLILCAEGNIFDGGNDKVFMKQLKDVLIVARQYAGSVDLDLVTGFYLESNNDYIIGSITKNADSKRIFPMLYSELCKLAEFGATVTIKPNKKEKLEHRYNVPDNLKTNIILKDNHISDILIKSISENKTSNDFSNIHIENKTCEDKDIHLNDRLVSLADCKKWELNNLVKDIDFRPPTSTCIENSTGRNFFTLPNEVGLLSKESANDFFHKNSLSVINTVQLTNLLNKTVDMYGSYEIKEAVDRILHINRINKSHDNFLEHDYEKSEDNLLKFEKEHLTHDIDGQDME